MPEPEDIIEYHVWDFETSGTGEFIDAKGIMHRSRLSTIGGRELPAEGTPERIAMDEAMREARERWGIFTFDASAIQSSGPSRVCKPEDLFDEPHIVQG